MVAVGMPAMLTTWWLWVLFVLALWGAVLTDKRVNWEERHHAPNATIWSSASCSW